CLLHDIGKPQTLSLDDDKFPTFYHHDKLSSELAVKIMNNLRFSGTDIKRAAHLISNHMFNYTEEWTDAAVRRFISKVGVNNIDDLFKLRIADQFGMTNSKIVSEKLTLFTLRINRILKKQNAFSIRDLNISGTDLQKECGIKKGPLIGTILKELLETVLDDPSLNNRDALLNIANNLGNKYTNY
ncbi:MAG: HD domain-containing protein, partial [Spirochaetota bacterium]|nr:HD domain-containing protein [Spirochaetota bacterium]